MTDRKNTPNRKGLGRREFLKGTLAAGAALTAPMVFVRHASAQQERVLKVVHWKHFVPDYDKWFDVFAKEFGDKNKCKVEVDYVATPDLPTAIAGDISRRSGHDVFHLNGTGAWLYDQILVDVTDIATAWPRSSAAGSRAPQGSPRSGASGSASPTGSSATPSSSIAATSIRSAPTTPTRRPGTICSRAEPS